MIVSPSGANRADWIWPRRNVSWRKEIGGRSVRRRAGEEAVAAAPARERQEGSRRGPARSNACADGSPLDGRHRPGRGRARHTRERLEVEGEIARRLEPLLRVLLEAVPHDPVDPRMDVLVRRREIRRLLRQDRRDRVRRRLAAERALARQHLVEDRAEGEEVAAAVRRLPPHLLRRHVAHRPEDDARAPCPRSSSGPSAARRPSRTSASRGRSPGS